MFNARKLFLFSLLLLVALAVASPVFGQNRTDFAGWRNSVDYAYGVTFPAGLQVAIGNTSTGAQSITLATGNITLGDGSTYMPLATNAPITVGAGSNQETVTPSAVSCLTPAVYQSCTITATFSNTHGTGDPVASATVGLQEAINAAAAKGGGTAVASPGWASAGGTTAILNAAVLPASGTVSILDNRGGAGSNIQTITVLVPNSAVKTLFSVGTQLLPAPGAGNAYDIQDIVFENVFLTAAFAAGGAIQASYGTGVTTPASATVAATFLTSPAANQMIKVAGALASTLSSAVTNKAITLAAATADFTTGGGSLIVKVSYRTLTGF